MSKILFKNSENKQCGYMELKNSADKPQIYLYGDICGGKLDKWSSEDKCPQDIADMLNEIDSSANVDIYINSGGGSVFGALAIVSQLNRHEGKTIAHIDGLAASAASFIALSCDEIIMNSSAQLMIHKPLTFAFGNSDDFQKTIDSLDKAQESIVDIYMSKVKDGVTREQINEKVNAETWLKGNEAAEIFNITLIDTGEIAACESNYFDKYFKTPENLTTVKSKQKNNNEDEKIKLQMQLDLIKTY